MPTAPESSGKRILICDDEAMVAQTFGRLLLVDRHTIDIANDGVRALEMLRAAKYDLVITDFKMPRMDGLELAEAVKKLCPTMPVILITAYIEALRDVQDPVSNVDSLLTKPISMAALRAEVRRLLGTAGPER